MKNDNTEINKLLHKGVVASFGIKYSLPDILKLNKRLVMNYNHYKSHMKDDKFSVTKKYHNLSDIFRVVANILFLDNDSIKVLLANYPNSAQYVFVRFSFKYQWIIGICGLIRRLLNNTVTIVGIRKFSCNEKSQLWLLLKNNSEQSRVPIHFTLNKKVGTSGLFEYLNANRINYIVPRFFEKLPRLFRENGGDLDLLVDDNDLKKVHMFLIDNSGDIPIDVNSVSNPTMGSGLPYFPPNKAKKMLNERIMFKNDVYIPNNLNYLFSLAYHALYHKGLSSGIKTKYSDLKPANNPENQYGKIIKILASKEGINSSEVETMEDIDLLLDKNGWRPKIDTLDHQKNTNIWVFRHHFQNKKVIEIGLSVIILKKIAKKSNLIKVIEDDIKKNHFTILRSKKLTGKSYNFCKTELRGGNWYAKNNQDYFHPEHIIIILDAHSGPKIETAPGSRISRVRELKKLIREKYDTVSGQSMIHATDDTNQSWDYISGCFPNEFNRIKDEIHLYKMKSNNLSIVSKLKFKFKINKKKLFDYLRIIALKLSD